MSHCPNLWHGVTVH